MDYYIKELQDEEFMSHDWESLMFFLSIALSYIYINTIFHDVLLCQSGQGYGCFLASQSLQKSLSFNKNSRWIHMNT